MLNLIFFWYVPVEMLLDELDDEFRWMSELGM